MSDGTSVDFPTSLWLVARVALFALATLRRAGVERRVAPPPPRARERRRSLRPPPRTFPLSWKTSLSLPAFWLRWTFPSRCNCPGAAGFSH